MLKKTGAWSWNQMVCLRKILCFCQEIALIIDPINFKDMSTKEALIG